MSPYPPFVQWLKQRRKVLDLTQADLAQRVGCALVTIQKFEEGQRRPSTQIAELLADHLAIPRQDREEFIRVARSPLPVPVGEVLPPSNLPNPLTALVDRQQEIATVRNLLQRPQVRLLTLVGTPGVGKTRLAIAAGHELRSIFTDGVWFVALAAVTHAEFLFAAIAQAVGVGEREQSSLRETLIDALRSKQMLLVLDNFEHLVDCSPSLADLLTSCPTLKALVTSRIPLRLSGEHEMAVLPFALPQDAASLAPQILVEHPAVHLLLDRVQAFQADFDLTGQNVQAIVALCTQLDGLPLALELAAARLRHFTAQELLDNFVSVANGRLHWLSEGARDLPQRQQTLRNAIAWSFDLLSASEQDLFVRLGVFVGSFDAAAAQAICGDAGAPDQSAFHQLQSLVDQQLLQVQDADLPQPRYMLLETLREFALERLTAGAEEADLRRRHVGYFLAGVEAQHPVLNQKHDEPAWLAFLTTRQDNLRAALDWSLQNDPPLALRLAAGLGHFWYLQGQWREGSEWLAQALARADTPAEVHARALTSLGVLLAFQGENVRAIHCYQTALERLAGEDAAPDRAWTLFNLGRALVMQGDRSGGLTLFAQSADIWQRLDYHWHVALAKIQSGVIAIEEGDWTPANRLLEESLALHRAWGAEGSVASALILLGAVEREAGSPARAISLIQEGHAIFQRLGRRGDEAWALRDLGMAALVAGQPAGACHHLLQSLLIYEEMGARDGLALVLEGLAGVAAAYNQATICAQLLGAVTVLRRQSNLANVVHSPKIDMLLFQPLRRKQTAEVWSQAIEAGALRPLAEALTLARSLADL